MFRVDEIIFVGFESVFRFILNRIFGFVSVHDFIDKNLILELMYAASPWVNWILVKLKIFSNKSLYDGMKLTAVFAIVS